MLTPTKTLQAATGMIQPCAGHETGTLSHLGAYTRISPSPPPPIAPERDVVVVSRVCGTVDLLNDRHLQEGRLWRLGVRTPAEVLRLFSLAQEDGVHAVGEVVVHLATHGKHVIRSSRTRRVVRLDSASPSLVVHKLSLSSSIDRLACAARKTSGAPNQWSAKRLLVCKETAVH